MSFLLSDKQRKRKKRYELTKLKDSYRVALKYWRGEPIRSQFYKKFEKRVRQLERILKVKQPAQDEKAMVTSVPLDEAGTSFELTHTASEEKALKVKQPEQCEEGTENEDETSLDDEPTGEDAAFYGEDPLLNPNSEKEDEEDKTSCEDEPAGREDASFYGEDPLLNPNAEKEEDFATCQEIAVRPLNHFEDKGVSISDGLGYRIDTHDSMYVGTHVCTYVRQRSEGRLGD